MVTNESITLEDVCKLANGFKNDYEAISYFIHKDQGKVKGISPKVFAQYSENLKNIVSSIGEDKPKKITFKEIDYKVNYNIRNQSWWPHAIYHNTISKIEEDNSSINPISLALACFMCVNINGIYDVEDISEFETDLLKSKNGVELFNAGFFLNKRLSKFKTILYSL